MANEHEDKAKKQAEDAKKQAEEQKKAAREAEEKKPAPTQDELNNTLENMVKEAEAAGRRDEPAIARAREMLDRREGGKDASKKG